MIFVQLMHENDHYIAINPGCISYFFPIKGGTRVVVDGHEIVVKENYSRVADAIERAGFSIWDKSLGL